MLALLDTTVFVDMIGDSDLERHASEHVLGAAIGGAFDSAVTIGSLQETLNVIARRRKSVEEAVQFSHWIAKTFRIVGHDAADAERLIDLFGLHPKLGALDSMIASAAERIGADFVVTRDTGFGQSLGERWVDPMDPDSLGRLVALQ